MEQALGVANQYLSRIDLPRMETLPVQAGALRAVPRHIPGRRRLRNITLRCRIVMLQHDSGLVDYIIKSEADGKAS